MSEYIFLPAYCLYNAGSSPRLLRIFYQAYLEIPSIKPGIFHK